MARKKPGKPKKTKKIEKMLEMLDERLIRGEISESTYNELKAKYSARVGEVVEKANVCPHCGAGLKPGAKFCANCGKGIGAVEKAVAPPVAPAAKPVEKPALKPGKTPWGVCPICGGEWPAELDECRKCKAIPLAMHSVHKNRSLLALGPRDGRPKGFAYVQYGARKVAFLIDWLPINEFSDGAALIRRYRDGTNDHALFKLKTREWDVHFHKGVTSPEKIVDFFARPSGAPAEVAPSKPSKPAGVYCSQCGTRIPEGSKFCPGCGAKVGS